MRLLSLLVTHTLVLAMILEPALPAFAAESRDRSSPTPTATVADDEDENPSDDLTIAPGFLLHLVCHDDAKINGDFRVGLDGRVSLPYDVTVAASGMKVKALVARLKKTYRPYFRETPKIEITVKQRRYAVKISGVVKNPGTYLLRSATTLDEALAMANVKTEDLPNGYARVEHGKNWRWISLEDYLKGGSSHSIPSWQGGEQILFQLEKPEADTSASLSPEDDSAAPSSRKVQVLGEVRNPGGASFQRNGNGYYYLIQRGGPTQYSDLDQVELLRRNPKTGAPERISVGSMKDLTDVHEADVLLVHPDRPSPVDRTLQNAGIIASVLTSIVLTVFVVRNNK